LEKKRGVKGKRLGPSGQKKGWTSPQTSRGRGDRKGERRGVQGEGPKGKSQRQHLEKQLLRKTYTQKKKKRQKKEENPYLLTLGNKRKG